MASTKQEIEEREKSYIEMIYGSDEEAGLMALDMLIADDEVDFAKSLGFILVEGGVFNRSADNVKCEVEDALVNKYTVTQRIWKWVMGENPSHFKDYGDTCPVDSVSWDMIQEFIKKMNEKIKTKINPATGKPYQVDLLDRNEWEFAARGGKKTGNFKYAGSDNLDEVAWYQSNSDGHTHPVGQKKPNELGLYDFCGNVFEWCKKTEN